MATVTINFEWSNGDSEYQDFEATSGVVSYIEDYRDERLQELNDDLEASDEELGRVIARDDIECDGYDVRDYDGDCAGQQGPDDFDDLEAWADYCDLVAEHGEAFVLRYNDLDDCDCMDEYNGCWSDAAEFVQNLIEDCYDLDIPSFVYVDWDRTARDVMMDYSSYDGSEGIHIFRS